MQRNTLQGYTNILIVILKKKWFVVSSWDLRHYLPNALQSKGTAKPSFLASQLDDLRNGEADSGITPEHIKGASASLYGAGAETVGRSHLTLTY